jgi:hypothetical protein
MWILFFNGISMWILIEEDCESGQVNKEYLKWEKQDQLLLSWLLLSFWVTRRFIVSNHGSVSKQIDPYWTYDLRPETWLNGWNDECWSAAPQRGWRTCKHSNDQNPKWRAVSEDSCRQIMFWSLIARSWFDHQTRLGVLLRACPWYGCSYASGLGMAWSITWLDLAQSRTQIMHFSTKWQTVLLGNCEPNSEVQTIELSSCFVKCWLLIMVSLGSSEPI